MGSDQRDEGRYMYGDYIRQSIVCIIREVQIILWVFNDEVIIFYIVSVYQEKFNDRGGI